MRSQNESFDVGSGWIIDSGASSHFVRDRHLFSSYQVLQEAEKFEIGDGNLIEAIGIGNIEVDIFDGNKWGSNLLLEVRHVPRLAVPQLISMGKITSRGFEVITKKDSVEVRSQSGAIVLVGARHEPSNIFELAIKTKQEVSRALISKSHEESSLMKWHEKMGHIGIDRVINMSKQGFIPDRGNVSQQKRDFACHGCALGKQPKLSLQTSDTIRDTKPGSHIHSDLIEKMEVPSISGSLYAAVFKCENKSYKKLFMLRSKDEISKILPNLLIDVKLETGNEVRVLRTDNGKEYRNKEVSEIVNKSGVKQEFSAPYVHEQNGFVERENRSSVDLARSMLCMRSLPKKLWAEAQSPADETCSQYTGTTETITDDEEEIVEEITAQPEPPRYSLRDIPQRRHLLILKDEPSSVEEALAGNQSKEWTKAMDEEIASSKCNKTWSLIELPEGRSPVACRWIFKIKENPDGTIQRYKARLVAKGFSQRPGEDYKETFAPVVRYESIRIVLALSSYHGMEISQFDVKTAFLYGEFKEDIYMEQLPGYNDGTHKVCKLHKGLYGLKQSLRQWNIKFTS